MRPLPQLLEGSISAEYEGILATKKARTENQTETCGSDCTDGGECQDSTCGQAPQKQSAKSKNKQKKQAFAPVVPGWNEPPAAHY
jgi:hypothetical protein